MHGNAVLCTFFDENEVCFAAGCSVIYRLLLMSSAAIFTSSEVHLARLALLGRLCTKMATISIPANTVRPSVDCRSDDTAFGAGTFSWQDPVHSWYHDCGKFV